MQASRTLVPEISYYCTVMFRSFASVFICSMEFDDLIEHLKGSMTQQTNILINLH